MLFVSEPVEPNSYAGYATVGVYHQCLTRLCLLLRSPDVDFCGYTIPHPSEPKMHIRLQTRQGKKPNLHSSHGFVMASLAHGGSLIPLVTPSDDVLRSGLTDLRKVSSYISDAYRKELKAFNRRRKN